MLSEYVGRPAGVRVRSFASRYTGYRDEDVAPAVHRGLPSPFLTLIVTLDDPLQVATHPDPRTPPGRYDTLLGGLHTTPATIVHQGRQSGIQIALSPLGARSLLGLPAGELANLDVTASDVLGPFIDELRDRVRAAPGWPERFRIVDAMLAARCAAPVLPPPEVVHAWRLLQASGGTVSTVELAREVGWSGRYLSRRFNVEIGLSPKAAARVARFDRARHVIQRGASLAAVAAGCGYYDQAHLTREFGALAGCPPARWLAEEDLPPLRTIQDPAAEDLPPLRNIQDPAAEDLPPFRNVQDPGGPVPEDWAA
ncbi:helix-turn-helix domain-containing protein [Dactylosporangium cerinum]|uniref:Helix-turn-helix domain-containing protein n=1 Tax=Dactylosporangium cerinum TaxID=1434730 RepID=A0ABV9VQ39_9ACTN